MKIYFKEVTTKDFSRVGYDNVSISYSLIPYDTEEGHDANAVWYFIEMPSGISQSEATRLAQSAINKALAEEISVSEALFSLTSGKRRRKKLK